MLVAIEGFWPVPSREQQAARRGTELVSQSSCRWVSRDAVWELHHAASHSRTAPSNQGASVRFFFWLGGDRGGVAGVDSCLLLAVWRKKATDGELAAVNSGIGGDW